jgi:nucleoside-diphosphate-sugar epimerase/glycosyltransferase involved in cell wall biosynthesis
MTPVSTSFRTEATLEDKIKRLQGPILILGGSGFIGANLLRLILRYRHDAFGTATRLPAWRIDDLPRRNVYEVDLLANPNLDHLLDKIRPRTVFDCVAYGGYSFETDSQLIYSTNFNLVSRLLERLTTRKIACYLHAGSSSEYGDNASGPREDATTEPNSHYAVSKVAAANLIRFYGKTLGLPCANLRLYSVYGPGEDSSRLIPNIVRRALDDSLPDFVDPSVSRDFIYVDDCSAGFIDLALQLTPQIHGESFNIGSGRKTTIRDIAYLAKDVLGVEAEPSFTMPARTWDVTDWYANIEKVRTIIGWRPQVELREGLLRTAEWFRSLPDKSAYLRSSKRFGLDTRHSVTAVVVCYKDNQAIPIMYARLKDTLTALNVDYEIIFVNDCSPDDSEEIIRQISASDPRVCGISHSRNFGSQAAFRSGMEMASKNSCVLLDGDLQDPPEMIAEFVARWRDGYDVVYGKRVKRQAPPLMQLAYKAFYRVFDSFSYLQIPHDAGDFSLLDKRVVQAMLRFPERDFFLRGVRAYAGFRQTGVDYTRPERLFGVTTNGFWKNIGWAKKGILSFSNVPLNILSVAGSALLLLTFLLIVAQTSLRIFFPALAPRGVTTLLIAILFFGSLNLFGISVAGEYISKVFEEVKRRPHFIRRNIIRNGESRLATAAEGEDS